MKTYKFSPAPWTIGEGGRIFSDVLIGMTQRIYPRSEEAANQNLILLAPTLHEVVTRCQAILSNYLEPEGMSKEDTIKELLDVLDDKELVSKLKELEV